MAIVGLTTLQVRDRIEAAGYQFLKDKNGWACYDADDRQEVPNTRHARYGESVHLATLQLALETDNG